MINTRKAFLLESTQETTGLKALLIFLDFPDDFGIHGVVPDKPQTDPENISKPSNRIRSVDERSDGTDSNPLDYR